MRPGKRALAALAVPLVAGMGAVAVAATTGPPSVQRIEGRIVFEHASARERACDGPGNVFEQFVTLTGRATGAPELTGRVEARVHALFDADSGDGFDEGTLRIRDAASGAWKAQGSFTETETDDISQGFLRGETRLPADATGDRSRLFANLRVSFGANGSISVQIGGDAGDGRLPAVRIGGRCAGAFESFEGDLPAPGQPAAAVRAAGARVAGWRAP